MIEAIGGEEPKAEAMWDQEKPFLVPVLMPAGKQGKGECLPAYFLLVRQKDRAFPLGIYTPQR